MNSNKYSTIRFTHELEENGKLPFLDMMLTRKQDGSIDIGVYRKPTSTKRFITSDSYCPPSHRMASFNSMVYRLCKFPLSAQNFMNELKYIKEVADINGYKESDIDNLVAKHSKKIRKINLSTFFLNRQESANRRVRFNFAAPVTNKLKTIYAKLKTDVVFSSETKLKNFLSSTKDKIDVLKKSGIYEIRCSVCGKVYLGQTKRNIETRFKEHCRCIAYNHPKKSAVAKHAIDEDHLSVKLTDLKLIKQVLRPYDLDAWESLHMYKNRNNLTNNEPEPIISPLFKWTN